MHINFKENTKQKRPKMQRLRKVNAKRNESSQQITRSQMKRKRFGLFVHLISSEWFIYFLDYLYIDEITQFDSAFCNHTDRCKWLDLLKGYRPSIEIHEEELVKWLILKDIHPQTISLDYDDVRGSLSNVSYVTVNRLLKNCSRTKNLFIKSNNFEVALPCELFPHIAENCRQLQNLYLHSIQIPDDGLEILSTTCHQLKDIGVTFATCRGLQKLIKANKGLVNLIVLELRDENFITGEIIDILGKYCPQLEKLSSMSNTDSISDLTYEQIESFTQGCRKIKTLHINSSMVPSIAIFDKIFSCLGNYNHELEILSLNFSGYEESTVQSTETVINDSLRCLSNGCPLLRDFSIRSKTRISTQAVTYLVNHSICLENLCLSKCCICDDGLIITKEADKLKHLTTLSLSFNNNITDDSIINLVTGCHSLKDIDIDSCPLITDISLFSIAANCPQLKSVDVYFNNNKTTRRGLNELLNKCPHLIYLGIVIAVLVPEIYEELNRRQLLRDSSRT